MTSSKRHDSKDPVEKHAAVVVDAVVIVETVEKDDALVVAEMNGVATELPAADVDFYVVVVVVVVGR